MPAFISYNNALLESPPSFPSPSRFTLFFSFFFGFSLSLSIPFTAIAVTPLFIEQSAMSSLTIAPPMPSSSPASPSSLFLDPSRPPMFVNFNRNFKSQSAIQRISNCLNLRPQELRNSTGVVSLRIQRLLSEFRSLPEPIDRVKRLLDYASALKQLTESTRRPENRVSGCAAQVWLEVEMDEAGRMRFGADSDSEITKGFCCCLIYVLDGAYPYEVMAVKGEDLSEMNVGIPVRSRVNSWHNVLLSMQKRTKSLVLQRQGCQLVDPWSSLFLSP